MLEQAFDISFKIYHRCVTYIFYIYVLKKYEKMFARIGGKWKRSEEQKMRTDSENLKKTKYFIFDFFEEQSKRPFTKPVKFNF